MIYPKAKEALGEPPAVPIRLLSNDLRVLLIDLTEYGYSPAHQALDDVPLAARIAVSDRLDEKTWADGVLDSADYEFVGVAAGKAGRALILSRPPPPPAFVEMSWLPSATMLHPPTVRQSVGGGYIAAAGTIWVATLRWRPIAMSRIEPGSWSGTQRVW